MSDLVREMIVTLEEAREALCIELSRCRAELSPDAALLVRLLPSVRSFATQADALFLMIAERDAYDGFLEIAEVLSDFFQGAQEKIDEMLKLSSD